MRDNGLGGRQREDVTRAKGIVVEDLRCGMFKMTTVYLARGEIKRFVTKPLWLPHTGLSEKNFL